MSGRSAQELGRRGGDGGGKQPSVHDNPVRALLQPQPRGRSRSCTTSSEVGEKRSRGEKSGCLYGPLGFEHKIVEVHAAKSG